MAVFGVYGKIAAQGDFIRRSAPQSFVGPWDRWLQAALLAGRAACGARWDGVYLSAPAWRFTLAPGLAGPEAILGVVMPSVDRIGRQFPLTVFTLADADHDANAATFAALEEVALDTLSDGATAQGLYDALPTLPPPAPPAGGPGSRWSALLGDGLHQLSFPGLPSPGDAVALFAVPQQANPALAEDPHR